MRPNIQKNDAYFDQRLGLEAWFYTRRDYLAGTTVRGRAVDGLLTDELKLQTNAHFTVMPAELQNDWKDIANALKHTTTCIAFIKAAPRFILKLKPTQITNILSDIYVDDQFAVAKAIVIDAMVPHWRMVNPMLITELLDAFEGQQQYDLFKEMTEPKRLEALLANLSDAEVGKIRNLFPININDDYDDEEESHLARFKVETYFVKFHGYARSFISNSINNTVGINLISQVLNPAEDDAMNFTTPSNTIDNTEYVWRRLYNYNRADLLKFIRLTPAETRVPYIKLLARTTLINDTQLFQALCETSQMSDVKFSYVYFLKIINASENREHLIYQHHNYLLKHSGLSFSHLGFWGVTYQDLNNIAMGEGAEWSAKFYLMAYYYPGRVIKDLKAVNGSVDKLKQEILKGNTNELVAYTLMQHPEILKAAFPDGVISSPDLEELLKLSKNPTKLIVNLADYFCNSSNRANFIFRAITCAVQNDQYTDERKLHNILTQTPVGWLSEGKTTLAAEIHRAVAETVNPVDATESAAAVNLTATIKPNEAMKAEAEHAIVICTVIPLARNAMQLTMDELAKIFKNNLLDQTCHFSLVQDKNLYDAVQSEYVRNVMAEEKKNNVEAVKSWKDLSLIFKAYENSPSKSNAREEIVKNVAAYLHYKEAKYVRLSVMPHEYSIDRAKLFNDIPEIFTKYDEQKSTVVQLSPSRSRDALFSGRDDESTKGVGALVDDADDDSKALNL